MRSYILTAIVLFSLVCGCDSPPLEELKEPAENVSLNGSFMTESPDEINYPVKVIFAIDCSLSMGDEEMGIEAGSDPHFLRIEAVRNFIEEYNTNDNTSFEVMLWSSNIIDRTAFTKDPQELDQILSNVTNDTTTDYLGTLDAIYTDIRNDILNSNEENRVRTKYIVIFLSDGVANTGTGPQDSDDIYESVENLTQMVEDEGIGGFNFHTFLLLGNFGADSSGQAMRDYAETVLSEMARLGNGRFSLFENAEAIDFLNIVDMRLAVEYIVKYMVAYNYNVIPQNDDLALDSDGDGLSDAEEQTYGTDPTVVDTDQDGYSDFLEIEVSSPGYVLDPLNSEDSNCLAVGVDSDDDGLCDCEELIKGTNRLIPDTDQDGIPDGIEFRMGTNPLEAQYTSDTDFDGVVDWLEVQRHTDVSTNDAYVRQNYSYQYDIKDAGLVEINQGTEMESYVRQYNFTISNISVMNTLAGTDENGDPRRAGDNYIRFFIAEVPEDMPNTPPIFRVADIIINANDSERSVTLTPGDFELLQ